MSTIPEMSVVPIFFCAWPMMQLHNLTMRWLFNGFCASLWLSCQPSNHGIRLFPSNSYMPCCADGWDGRVPRFHACHVLFWVLKVWQPPWTEYFTIDTTLNCAEALLSWNRALLLCLWWYMICHGSTIQIAQTLTCWGTGNWDVKVSVPKFHIA